MAVVLVIVALLANGGEAARVTGIRSHLPCSGPPHGRDVLRCGVEGRKTEIMVALEVNNRRGGGDVLYRHVIDVLPGGGGERQQPNHRLSEDLYSPRFGPDGQPLPPGVQPSVCHGPAYCTVPVVANRTAPRTGVALTVRLDRQRTAWTMRAAANHVPFAQLQRELVTYDPTDNSTLGTGPYGDPTITPIQFTLSQVPDILEPPLTGDTADAASFFVDASALYECMAHDARFPYLDPATLAAKAAADTADLTAAVSAAGAPFSVADSDPLIGQLGHTAAAGCGCDAALCFNPRTGVELGVIEVAEFGNRCLAHAIDGRGYPLFVIEVTVEDLESGATATAYTIVKGRGHTSRFWQEDQTVGRATIAARAHIAPHKRNAYENAAGPEIPGGAGVMVCGREHFSTWRPAGRRLPSAAQYWNGVGTSTVPTENANITFAVQQAAGLPLTVPTALGHPSSPVGTDASIRHQQPGMDRGSDQAWYWLQPERFEQLGRQCGQVGASRCDIFGHSQARLDALCAGTLNCTPPFEDQPVGAFADLNVRAAHVPTQEFVRNLAAPGLSRTAAGALPRSEYLPPTSLWDEAAPSLYLARVDGGSVRLAGGQPLPLSLVLEENRARGAASATEGALEDQRHDVVVGVELDDSWLVSPVSEHFAARANGTVYYQELLQEGSKCYRHEDRERRGDMRLGHGNVQLTFCPVVDMPVRTERHGSDVPLTKAYRAEIMCDAAVGSFAPVSARLDTYSPTHVVVHFRLKVGGPADGCTRVANVLPLVQAQASARMPSDPATGPGDATFTGACNVTLYSDEPESRHVRVGDATVLPCMWFATDELPESYKPTYVVLAKPECGWISGNSHNCPEATIRLWVLILAAVFVALLVFFSCLACFLFGKTRAGDEWKASVFDSSPLSSNDAPPVGEEAASDDY